MAAKAFNDWVEGDVAIEIIGKMIAEENERLNGLLDSFERQGIAEEDEVVQQDERCLSMIRQLDAYDDEIQAIYAGENTAEIFKKVMTVYAPHIKQHHASLTLAH